MRARAKEGQESGGEGRESYRLMKWTHLRPVKSPSKVEQIRAQIEGRQLSPKQD